MLKALQESRTYRPGKLKVEKDELDLKAGLYLKADRILLMKSRD
jgi:hypothetical protein